MLEMTVMTFPSALTTTEWYKYLLEYDTSKDSILPPADP